MPRLTLFKKLNIIRNAVEALSAGGSVRIATLACGETAVITVSDNGTTFTIELPVT